MNHGQQSGEAKHEDDAALTEFLASLMDYTPTVNFPLLLFSTFSGSPMVEPWVLIEPFGFVIFIQIPDDLVEHYLAKSGFQCPDVRL